jgi:eukaryotic-like serine/threonine-protein kinase
MANADHERLVGRTIAGKFVIEDLLGSGAMGAVFRARQIALDKTVAIKVLHSQHNGDPQFAARFQREARAASRLNHPNSMQVLDFGAEPDGLLYIAMEYLDGRSLHSVLRDEWPLAPKRTADLLMQTLAALAVAHDMGVVHRDLKPENVMVLRGTDDDGKPKDIVKVCDFGIAKVTDPRAYRGDERHDSDAPLTTAGFLVGTPEYMSPEQGRGDALDPRSDLYSVGVILFELLTKRVPFDAQNAIGIVLKHITEEPPLPSEIVAGVDPRLEAIARRALKKAREERYPNAREMRAELRVVAEGPIVSELARPAVARPSGPPSVIAATVAMPMAPQIAGAASGGTAKPTLHGTTAAVAKPPVGRRGLVLAGVTLAALVAGVSGTATLVRALTHAHHVPAPAAPAASAIPLAIPTVLSSATDVLGPSRASEAETPPVSPAGPVTERAPPKGLLIPPANAKPGSVMGFAPERPASPGAPPPVRVASSSGPAPASASASASEPPRATPSAVAAVNPPEPVAPEPPDPSFDPNRGYVEIGIINVEGMRERAIRSALHGVGLSQCYKAALLSRGARATGVATLSLSFDESGLARSAIVTGADFLPGLARCVQNASAGVHVAGSQVESGGGVAEVTLAFREP